MEEQFYMIPAEYKEKVIEMKKRESNVYEDSNKPNINRYDESMIINYTHCEFHPTMTIGIIAGNIPFANHNQGPRNIFQYANQIGISTLFINVQQVAMVRQLTLGLFQISQIKN